MASITLEGYNDIKAYVISSWAYISIQTDTGSQIFRLPTSDARITWTGSTVNPITATIVLKGSDIDIQPNLPTTFGRVQFYKTNASANGLTAAEAFTTFTMTSVDDQLTIKFNINFPL